MRYVLVLVLFANLLFASECDSKIFPTLSANSQISVGQLIDRLSDSCQFSVIIKDKNTENELLKKLSTTNLRNFTLKQAFDYILLENGFSYTYSNNVLTIRYLITKTFKVDYIATSRKGQSNVMFSGQSTFAASSSSTASNNTNQNNQQNSQSNASTTIQTTDDFRFWGQIEEEIKFIVDSNSQKPQQNEYRQIGTMVSEQELNSLTPGVSIASLINNGTLSKQQPTTQSVQKTQTSVIVNKEAGLITVTANKDAIKEVGNYLDMVMDRLHRQVFIDVNILQVDITNGSQEGINWEKLTSAGGTFNYNLQSAGAAAATGNFIQFAGSLSVSQILGFLNTQGKVTAVSNPKAMTLNNQPAVVFSGKIIYYPNVSGGTSGTATSGATNPNVTATPLQVGIALDITPEILDNDEIMLKINPSISACETRNCPLQQISVAGQSYSMAPNLAQQQLASLVKVNNGEKVILGGLIKKDNSSYDAGLPLLSSIPLFGRLFNSSVTDDSKSELVIIITPYISKKAIKAPTLKELGYKQAEQAANE